MSTELDLDKLRGAWQTVLDEKNYSTQEIFLMLKRKSITSVKWVFIISLIEILMAVALYIYIFSQFGISEYHHNLVEDYGKLAYVYEALNFIVYGVNFWFIYMFFQTYQKIHVHSSVKGLSLDIVKFRNTVSNFIKFNLVMLLIVIIIAVVAVWLNNPDLKDVSLFSSYGMGILVGILVMITLIFGIIWLYYYVVYGTFQRRLKRNLKDLDSL